ncbi:hypothetical protein HYX00_04745 [Candidatus Woesearchaeota archaeon]|nr:hypothetical protein [Candidatus Woesearchaeota archaeon]
MKISFYEEFPTKENLDKIKLINFNARIIAAAKSLKEFYIIKSTIKKYNNKNVKEIIYWPVLDEKEGYWFSAFTKNSALKRIINELQRNKNPLAIMWDAELPFHKSLILRQAFNYFRNRKLILDFFENSEKYKIKILTSEYPLESKFFRRLLFDLFLISFDTEKYKNKKIAMLYTSFLKNHPNVEHFLERQMEIGKRAFGENFVVALGTIASGINGNEPILSHKELERDLIIAKNNGINEVVIFRLGGLNEEYVKVIKKLL